MGVFSIGGPWPARPQAPGPDTGEFSPLRQLGPRNYFDIALGRSNVVLSLNVNTWDKLVHIQIYMGQRVAERLLEGLQEERETIESELGGALEWNPNPQKLDKVIRLARPGDIEDREQWTELAERHRPSSRLIVERGLPV